MRTTRPRRSSRARHAVVIVPALAAALVLTGCGRPGTAATVDGERITEGQVGALVADLERLASTAQAGAPVDPAQALSTLVQAPTILDVVAEFGATASDQEAVALLDSVVSQGGLEPWDYSAEIRQVAQLQLASPALQADEAASLEVGRRLAALDVDLNPRFGTWQDGQIAPTQWPWLVPSAS
ncbi:hypothetical protein [Litorihabitans aurantiacus]|nr:hypothetical protein [Litorihabitans aurantiacus]